MQLSQLEVKITSMNAEVSRLQSEKAAMENLFNNEQSTLETRYKAHVSEFESKITKYTTDILKLQSDNAALESELSRASGEKGSYESQQKLIVTQLEGTISFMNSEISRYSSQVGNLDG
jgi:chromosome segregation ATPase